ncbi:hypothetical protein AC579_2171 [Pseudocercospora musae]|uniref:DUF7779 domain-containing protein n=1 Tax=Pseudocercospora musae TaxID=113226 RepID=A0A139HYG8_9PEZI|nr:hypothetical protein AC579_2171 [Pseudocercospora musae]
MYCCVGLPSPRSENEPMSTEDAVSMMIRASKCEDDDNSKSQAIRLASRLDGLPLALQQVSSYVRRKYLDFAEILPLRNDETIAKSVYAARDRFGHTMATVWASQAIGPSASDLLQVLSFLDSESVSEMIRRGSPGVWPEREATFWANKLAYLEARAQLRKYSLIKRNQELDQLSIHRLVQDATRLQMNGSCLSKSI